MNGIHPNADLEVWATPGVFNKGREVFLHEHFPLWGWANEAGSKQG